MNTIFLVFSKFTQNFTVHHTTTIFINEKKSNEKRNEMFSTHDFSLQLKLYTFRDRHLEHKKSQIFI